MNAPIRTVERAAREFGVLLICLAAVTAAAGWPRASAAEPRGIQVISVRRIFHNGEHNAFTDLCRFQGQLYLTFRSCPDGHMVHPTSSIIVLSSEDGNQWRQVHRFQVPKRDTRDPHFLIFRDQLFVYTGTWYCGDRSPKAGEYEYDLNRHLGYAAWTSNGRRWDGPAMLEGTYGHYIWRAAAYGGKAYLCGRRKHEFAETQPARSYPHAIVESAMLESDDGLIWKKAALFKEHDGDETAFLFEPDGSVLAVVRGNPSQLCRSRPPYQQWQRKDLGRFIGGPLLARWGDRYLVGGRKTLGGKPTTALYWLLSDELREVAELPSAGDNSYPGFIELSPTRALVSYYSSHEKDQSGKPITAIYLAELAIEEATPGNAAQ